MAKRSKEEVKEQIRAALKHEGITNLDMLVDKAAEHAAAEAPNAAAPHQYFWCATNHPMEWPKNP